MSTAEKTQCSATSIAETSQNVVNLASKMIEEYKPSKMTPTTHADEFLVRNKIHDEPVAVFCREVFYGVERYNQLTKTLADGLYHQNSGSTQRNDYTMYCVMCYLAVCRIRELGFFEIRRLVLGQDPAKMHMLLTFLFGSNLDKWIPEQLSIIYDYAYVDQTLMVPMLEIRADVEDLLDYLETEACLQKEKAAAKSGPPKRIKSRVPLTESKPFNLTKPRPRGVPEASEKIDTCPVRQLQPACLMHSPRNHMAFQTWIN
eukprot:276641_1